jgi:hypothetical protein
MLKPPRASALSCLAAGFYLKLMELAPDLSRVKVFVTSVSRVRAQPAELEDALAENFPTRAGASGPLAWARLIDEATYSESAELTTAFNVRALPWLLQAYAPDTELALVGYINTDVLQHATLALITPGAPVYDDADRDGRPDGMAAARTGFLQSAYVGADRTLAAAWGAMPPDTVVFAASDHGFAATWKAVYAPRVLQDAGFQPDPQTSDCAAPERVLVSGRAGVPPGPALPVRPRRRLSLRRCAPPGERRRLWCAAPERLRLGQASLRRQGERAGRGRATFSARVEAGRGGEAVAKKGFQWRRCSAQLSWHKRWTIIMACRLALRLRRRRRRQSGSIGRPAQPRVQPTPLSRRGHQATVRAFRLCLQSERAAARLTLTLGGCGPYDRRLS